MGVLAEISPENVEEAIAPAVFDGLHQQMVLPTLCFFFIFAICTSFGHGCRAEGGACFESRDVPLTPSRYHNSCSQCSCSRYVVRSRKGSRYLKCDGFVLQHATLFCGTPLKRKPTGKQSTREREQDRRYDDPACTTQ